MVLASERLSSHISGTHECDLITGSKALVIRPKLRSHHQTLRTSDISVSLQENCFDFTMDSVSLGKGEGRAVNWSYPMNNSTHLPPKSPGAYSMFGSASSSSSSSSLFNSSGGFNLYSSYPVRGGSSGTHKRTPSAGYLPHVQPRWLEEIMELPDGEVNVVSKKCSHRRSSSDSVTFVDTPHHDCTNFIENVMEEEDEFVVLQEPPAPTYRPTHRRGLSAANVESSQYDVPSPHGSSSHRRGISADFYSTRLEEEQFVKYLPEIEAFRNRQLKHGAENAASCRGGSHLGRTGSSGDIWHSEIGNKKHVTRAAPGFATDMSTQLYRGRNQKASFLTTENRSTASDSNSYSDDSNDDTQIGRYGRGRSKSEMQFRGEGEESHGDGPLGFDQLELNLDPKKAKRILANRQSAQRSRVRKLQYISELERSVSALETEVSTLSPKVGFYDHRRAVLTAENVKLKQKLIAFAQTQRLKDAHKEALKKEVQRLSQLYNQQKQPQQHMQYMQPRPLLSKDSDLPLNFSKLDLGPLIPKPKSLDTYPSGPTKFSGGKASPLYSAGSVVPTPS